MSAKSKRPFDAQVFLASAGVSRKIVEYPRGTSIFLQGHPCGQVLYIQNGNVQLSVLSQSGREAIVAMLGAAISLARGVSQASRFAWERRRRQPTARSFSWSNVE